MAKLDSKILTSERVGNKERRFGSAVEYYPVMLTDDKGEEIPALFTKSQLDTAIKRASENMEDIPSDWSWVDWLLG